MKKYVMQLATGQTKITGVTFCACLFGYVFDVDRYVISGTSIIDTHTSHVVTDDEIVNPYMPTVHVWFNPNTEDISIASRFELGKYNADYGSGKLQDSATFNTYIKDTITDHMKKAEDAGIPFEIWGYKIFPDTLNFVNSIFAGEEIPCVFDIGDVIPNHELETLVGFNVVSVAVQVEKLYLSLNIAKNTGYSVVKNRDHIN